MGLEVAKANLPNHFVLVHGACHGAWYWYKLKPLLESAGQRVTAIDLSASGINTRSPDEIEAIDDYADPLMKLMASIPAHEKVILVGHSYGGYSLALAMEKFPEKISVAIFVAAFMPDVNHSPQFVMEQHQARSRREDFVDTQYLKFGSPEKPTMMILMGPKDLATNFYQLCPVEDIELGKLLVRPSPVLKQDFSEWKLSAKGYGSVRRAYVLCTEDKAIKTEFQYWLVSNVGADEVKVIEGADHMPMFSRPKELCQSLLEIAEN